MKISTGKNSLFVCCYCFLLLSLLTINGRLFSVFGGSIKLVHISLLVLIWVSSMRTKVEKSSFIAYVIAIVIPWLPISRINDLNEWIKSYCTLLLIVTFIFVAFIPLVTCISQNLRCYVQLTMFCWTIIDGLGIIQFIMSNFGSYHFLENVWGKWQNSANQIDVYRGYYRAYSLFIEPSFFAWVANIGLALVLFFDRDVIKQKQRIVFIVLSSISVFCSFSTTGIFFWLALIIIAILSTNINKSIKVFICTMGLVCGYFVVRNTTIWYSMMRIFWELKVPNTSGYERIVTPFIYMKDVLMTFPLFGRGIGQEGNVDLIGTVGNYPGVHNAVFGIFVWFGISGLYYVAYIFIFFKRRIKINKKWILIVIAMLGIYLSTGSFLSLDTFGFNLVLLFLPMAYEKGRKQVQYGREKIQISNN